MKGSKMKIAATLVAAAVTLGGCGEALYEMTPEEQEAVVSYASHAVAKFNNFQKDGEVFVRKDILEEDTDTQEKAQDVQTPPEDGAAGNTDAAPKTDDSQDGAENAGSPSAPQGQETESSSTIGEALDLGVIRADFMGSSLCATYEKSASYAVDAPPGSQLLVKNVKLVNQSSEDLAIDILAMTPAFSVTVNGEYTAAAQTTILPNDLSTFQGSLLAGESGDTVLLFEIPQEISAVSDLSLKVTMNGSQNTIKL